MKSSSRVPAPVTPRPPRRCVAKRLNQMGVDAFVLKYRTIYVDSNTPAAGRGGGSHHRSASGSECA